MTFISNLRALLSKLLGIFLLLSAAVMVPGVIWFAWQAGDWTKLAPLILAILAWHMGWERCFPSIEQPMAVDMDDPLMQAATAESKRQFSRFRAGAANRQLQPFLKYPLPLRDGGIEHVWCLCMQLQEETALVTVANETADQPKDDAARFEILLNEVEDWMLAAPDGNIEGGYTTAAMARIHRRKHGYLPRSMQQQLTAFKDIDVAAIARGE